PAANCAIRTDAAGLGRPGNLELAHLRACLGQIEQPHADCGSDARRALQERTSTDVHVTLLPRARTGGPHRGKPACSAYSPSTDWLGPHETECRRESELDGAHTGRDVGSHTEAERIPTAGAEKFPPRVDGATSAEEQRAENAQCGIASFLNCRATGHCEDR